MSLQIEDVFKEMMSAGADVFADNWGDVSTYAESEFRKMAQQIVDIADNVALNKKDSNKGYNEEAAKILMNMQRLATANVLVAMSTMTLVTAEQAINAMLATVNKALGGAISAIL